MLDLADVQDIKRVTYNPDDVIVVRLASRPTSDQAREFVSRLRDAFPTQKILVFDKTVSLDIVTPTV